ncbi:MAG: FAD-linked oxidase C-terminal domain-containing protein [Capsulimonadales bacterium]|nr:FAD-linked oxidase C-terminal domain-containing protein [Capsulimonadales bacterium]
MDKSFLNELHRLLGDEGMRSTTAQKHVYSSDAYTIEKALPGVVVLPRTTAEVSEIARLCHTYKVPLVPRGAGTGLAGGSLAHDHEVLLSTARMNRILNVDIPNRRVRAQAGVVNTYLTKAVAPQGYLYAPDPSSQGVCTIGGNVANNSGGPHTLKYGVTVNHILATQVVLPDGTVIELSLDDHGYDLVGLMTGSEGTLGIVTEATVRIVPAPESIRTLLAICRTIDDATRIVSNIIAAGILPAALEMIDRTILEAVEAAYHLGLPSEAGAVLLIEVDGPEAGIDEQAKRIRRICIEADVMDVKQAANAEERAKLWMARKKSIGTIGRLAPSCATQDGVAPRTRLPQILKQIGEIGRRYNLRIANVFHAGDGNLHPAVLFDERDPEEVKRVLAAGGEILKACVAAGGSLTGEHGIGIEKQEFLSLVFSDDDLDTMYKVRSVFNPNDILNPGKLLPAGGNCCPHLPRIDDARLRTLSGKAAAV